jgi:hypothetical protein
MPVEDSRRKREPRGKLDKLREQEILAGEVVEIDSVSPELVGHVIIRIVLSGGAFFIGTTSDGGAVKVTVYDGGEKEAKFLHSSAELETFFRRLAALYE